MTRDNGKPTLGEEIIDIQWAADGERIRRVVKRSNTRNTGKLPSWKMGRMVHWESVLELEALHLHNADPAVILVREQPARLRYELNGEVRTHVPDFYVESEGRRIFREVKTAKEAAMSEIRQRTEFLKSILPMKGYEYDVITEEEIRVQPRLENAKLITRVGKDPVTMIDAEAIRREFQEVGYVMWADVKNDCFGQYSAQKVCRLILEGTLSIDMNNEITGDSRVCIAGTENGGGHHG